VTDVVQHGAGEAETPVSAEQAIDFCIRQIRRAPDTIRQRLEIFHDAKQAYDLKMAEVADATEGTEYAKKRAAIRACVDERKAMDTAKEALEYARERARAYQKELSGLQSVNKSVTNSYNTAGWQR
jgi:uncharacterized coiled-coil DUF342 family protein